MLADQGHSLETIRHDLVEEGLDPSRLAGLLRKRLPGTLPNCQIEARIFPDKELLTFPAEGMHTVPEAGWRWMQSQTTLAVIHSGKEFPWGGEQFCPCDLILAPMLSEAGFGLGGLAVWSAGVGDELSALLPVVEGLRPLLARAMSQALGTSRQVVSHNVAEQLAAAARIQIDLLPARMPRLPGWDLAARLEPALETSGDFYDLIPLANNHWGLVIADVSDKGMGAALFMALSSTLIRTYAKQYPTLPALSISTVNERILSDSRSGMFVTAFYAVLEPFSGRMRYVNAGHNPPILVSHQKSKATDWLPSTGMALGVMGDLIWKQKVARLLPGDLMVMYTDGVTDAQNPRGEFYGEQRLLSVVRRCGCSAQETLDAIMGDLDNFTGGYPQGDDITLLVIRRDGRG
jgi:serine phosphatase RsbU (regulator of sigma subunit)